MSKTNLISVLGVDAAHYCLLFPDTETLRALSLTCSLFARIGRRIQGNREQLTVEVIINKHGCSIAHHGHSINHIETIIDFISVCKIVQFQYMHRCSNVSTDVRYSFTMFKRKQKN